MEGVKVPNSLLPPYIFQMIESQTIWSIEPTQDLISVYWFSWCLRRWQHIQQGWIHSESSPPVAVKSSIWPRHRLTGVYVGDRGHFECIVQLELIISVEVVTQLFVLYYECATHYIQTITIG
ncbi:hypothetical protein PC118_g9046 [Phytophthora cactorum]|uniref:Uncharacterized protein n=1 Tax=Phytophthora cactorum TaxID=29920 RepID=A0A8T1G1M2_9STRA|nr:hypothetical protein PC118_g9046 [Phytophthora cactorum]